MNKNLNLSSLNKLSINYATLSNQKLSGPNLINYNNKIDEINYESVIEDTINNYMPENTADFTKEELELFYKNQADYARQFSDNCKNTINQLQKEKADLEHLHNDMLSNEYSYFFISEFNENPVFSYVRKDLSYDGSKVLSPQEVENIIIMNIQTKALNSYVTFDSNKEIEAAKKFIAEEYAPKFEIFIQKQMGMSYEEYNKKISDYNKDILQLKGTKYRLDQTVKENPYFIISLTDDYQNFIENFSLDKDTYWYDRNIVKHNMLWESKNNNLSEMEVISNNNVKIGESFASKNYNLLTEQNKMMYNYLYEKQGAKAANEYLKNIEDTLNQRAGLKEAENFITRITSVDGTIDTNAINILKTSTKGIGDGVDNFTDGLKNVFETEGMISTNQYAQMFILSELVNKKVLTGTYEVSTSVGNIMPAMAASLMVSVIATPLAGQTFILTAGESATAITTSAGFGQVIGSTAGYALSASSSFGNSKNRALVQGEDLVGATVYGACTGVSSFTLGKLLGNIPFLNQNSEFALAKILNQGVVGSGQVLVDAGLQATLFDKPIEASELTGETGKAFLYGVLLSSVMTGATKTIKFAVEKKSVELTLEEALELYELMDRNQYTEKEISNYLLSDKINNNVVGKIAPTANFGTMKDDGNNSLSKYAFNDNGNYKINENLFGPDVLMFAKPVNKVGSIPFEMGKDLEKMFFNENDVIGIHRTGDASLDRAGKVLESGIELTGHDSSGVGILDQNIDLEKSITLFENKNLVNFAIFLHQIQAAAAYKTTTGSGDAVIVSIPKLEINNINAITDINQDNTPVLKPKYIMAAINSTGGNLSNFRVGSNSQGKTENITIPLENYKPDMIKANVKNTSSSTSVFNNSNIKTKSNDTNSKIIKEFELIAIDNMIMVESLENQIGTKPSLILSKINNMKEEFAPKKSKDFDTQIVTLAKTIGEQSESDAFFYFLNGLSFLAENPNSFSDRLIQKLDSIKKQNFQSIIDEVEESNVTHNIDYTLIKVNFTPSDIQNDGSYYTLFHELGHALHAEFERFNEPHDFQKVLNQSRERLHSETGEFTATFVDEIEKEQSQLRTSKYKELCQDEKLRKDITTAMLKEFSQYDSNDFLNRYPQFKGNDGMLNQDNINRFIEKRIEDEAWNLASRQVANLYESKACIFDILDSVTFGKNQVYPNSRKIEVYGHGEEYYSKVKMRYLEQVAQYFCLKVQNNQSEINILRYILGDSWYILMEKQMERLLDKMK